MGELVYFPPNGTFNLMYYPYYGKKAQVTHTHATHSTQHSFRVCDCNVFSVSGELHSAAGCG